MAEITLYPAVNGDDYCWGSSFWASDSFVIGNITGSSRHAGVRFLNVTIPQGSTITSAVLTLYASGNASGTTCNASIYGNAEDNAVAPTGYGEAEALSHTTEVVAWSGISAWTNNIGYDTPNISAIIQEIVDRVGWASGNALQLLFVDNSSSYNAYRVAKSYDAGSGYPRLVITYEETPQLNASIVLPLSVSGQLQRGRSGDIAASIALPLSVSGTLLKGALGDIAGSIALPLSISGTLNVPNGINGSIALPLSISGTLNSPIVIENWGASVEFPVFTLDTYGHDSCFGVMSPGDFPLFVLTGVGVINELGSGGVILPILSLSGTGRVELFGSSIFTLPRFVVSAIGNVNELGNIDIAFPKLKITAVGVSGVMGAFSKSLPLFSLYASDVALVTGEVSFSLPLFDLFGQGVLSDAEYLTMVMNIRNRALTIYNSYNFNSLCRFNNINFGANSTGIYNLDSGNTDEGALIDWNFRIGYLDLEQKVKKKLTQAWISYRSDGDIVLTVIQPDGQEFEYSLEGINENEEGVRIIFGRGLRSKYVALDIRNENGSTIDLDTIKLHLFQTEKRR